MIHAKECVHYFLVSTSGSLSQWWLTLCPKDSPKGKQQLELCVVVLSYSKPQGCCTILIPGVHIHSKVQEMLQNSFT